MNDDLPTMTPEAARAASYLEGAAFPADRSNLISHASLGGAPEEILILLESIPDRTYPNLSRVIDQINNILSHHGS